MRIIPRRTRVSMEFFKGIGVPDLIVALLGGSLMFAALLSQFEFRLYLAIAFFALTVTLIMPLDDQKVYMNVLYTLAYLVRPKYFYHVPKSERKLSKDGVPVKPSNDTENMVPFTGIDGQYIEYGGKYYGVVISIPSIEFRFLTVEEQNSLIDRVYGSVLRTVAIGETASMVKIDRPIVYDDFIKTENEKMEQLKEAYRNDLITEEELKCRVGIIYDRIAQIREMNERDLVYVPFHYLAFYGSQKDVLNNQARQALSTFANSGMECSILKGAELAIFLKYGFTQNFNEREAYRLKPEEYMEWILPKEIVFKSRTVKIDGLYTNTLRVSDYPLTVENGWGAQMFNNMSTKVVLKMKPKDRVKGTRQIDRAIQELGEQGVNTGKASRLMEVQTHIETLREVLYLIQGNNEVLFDVNIYITVFDYEYSNAMSADSKISSEEKKRLDNTALWREIRRSCREEGFRTNTCMLQQYEAYSGSMISASDPFLEYSRGIHSGSIAAAFPYVFNNLFDKGGICIGKTSGVPVFINFFLRNKERVNSNAVIIGKSGSGKSYATKSILAQLAAEDCKIFILDPENEYSLMAENFKGKIIDVGSATQGRLNPFHIITSLSDDEEKEDENDVATSFYVHLQFLEEFYRQILPGIESEPLEYLNNITVRMYAEKGIDEETDLSKLTPSDFPTFDDLYDKVLNDYQLATGENSEYSKAQLRTLISYIAKFATGGRNSALWNGETSISTNENFIVFNFQSLLANKNNTIANAQMLLVLKWLDNEIIKNREYNMLYKAERKIIVVIDEAHVFIDEKFPITLDFMYQLAKRIRKYNGMQIIITQNVRDFVGTEELARKSTAIINASQYSFIFALAPNDMNDLCKLYEKSGALNKSEQYDIVNNGRGRAFLITSPTMRTTVDIQTSKDIEQIFTM